MFHCIHIESKLETYIRPLKVTLLYFFIKTENMRKRDITTDTTIAS